MSAKLQNNRKLYKKAYRTREMVWIDFKKAFDMVPDSWLIIKMLRSLWGWEIELAA